MNAQSSPIGINTIISCPSETVQQTLISVIEKTSHIAPVASRNTPDVQRALYAPAQSRFIINVPKPNKAEWLGRRHYVCVALEVRSTEKAARCAKRIFREKGYDSEIHRRLDPKFPRGFVVGFTSNVLEGIMIMFWPSQPSAKVVATLPKPKPWRNKS